MRWPRKTRPNLHSRVVSHLVNDNARQRARVDHLNLANKNVRLLAADCLSGNKRLQRVIRCDVVDMSISVLRVEITKPEPTMSHGRAFHLRTNLFKKMQILKRKLPNLRLTYTLRRADKTSAR